uniref:BAH domain-containing protein n=1 Tax=Proboscia inermis TaxID=420281 RepID=A0A7S0C5Z1_9STRA|mmetsp:Transcript_23976/g.27612  ORF Transcript_23976/g.27612 Transcript_23976/m.27612 type:complete len:102 (-) Transcript_23976:112-417(-)|eukprot:CAMPEP_0194387790 /NCGR_PEP_ID=MMETSP0174-20130528/94434_1 /TAXON_ID=216777 /ORGANISM="Proboscia alata, Strain PI-D3" /LENGTH=101 /DNA_ID=CAMNT_0039178369 /DNA_START=211 /DNA_END=516 /DNA_ORIENTATION=+
MNSTDKGNASASKPEFEVGEKVFARKNCNALKKYFAAEVVAVKATTTISKEITVCQVLSFGMCGRKMVEKYWYDLRYNDGGADTELDPKFIRRKLEEDEII